MANRLKKRGALALIIYFLMITAISTPIAFHAGKARGAGKARPDAVPTGALSQNEPGADSARLPIPLALAPETSAANASNAAANETGMPLIGPRTPSLKPAALRDAVLRAIAGGPSQDANGDAEAAGPPPSPFNLAMAPDMPGGLVQGGAANAPGGYPGAIIPGFLAGPNTPPQGPTPDPDPGNPDGETPGVPPPPVIVTPVPAALPLMLTGLTGLFALRKRPRA